MTFKEAIERAIKKCAEKKQDYCVIEIDRDDGEGREIAVCRERYVREPEFEAWCGEVLADVSFDKENGIVSVDRYGPNCEVNA